MFCLLLNFAFCDIKFTKLDYLLPFKDAASRASPSFIVESSGSTCIEWENANPNLIRVNPLKQGSCSKAANIEVIVSGIDRKVAVVYATSKTDRIPLTFYINKVNNITFKSSTRSIFIESDPRTFKLVGFDERGNTFDTLDGLKFDISIDKTHLREITPSEENIEVLNNQISVQGTKIGKTFISATGKNVNSTVLDLIVIEPIGLFPGPVLHVLENHTILFRLCSIRGINNGKSERKCTYELKGDLLQKYEFTLSENLMTISNDLIGLTQKIGMTILTVSDKDAEDNVDSVTIYIEKPVKVIQPDLYIAIGDDPVFTPEFICGHGNTMNIFSKVWYLIDGRWDTLGKHLVQFTHLTTKWQCYVYVCPPIVINPEEPVLPVGISYSLNITGGSGFFSYSLSHQGILSNTNSLIATYKEGKVMFTVNDQKIAKYNKTIQIIVSYAKSADINVLTSEILVGSTADIKCHFLAMESREFTVQPNYRIKSETQAVVTQALLGIKSGFSRINCLADSVSSPDGFVSVLERYTAMVDGIAAPDSTIPLITTGGPLHWPNSDPPVLTISCPSVTATTISDLNKTFSVSDVFKGYCDVTARNSPTNLNPTPLTMKASFNITVLNVDHFTLHATDPDAPVLSICQGPYISPQNIPISTQSIARLALGHTVTIHSFARSSDGRIIIYHDRYTEAMEFNDKRVATMRNIKRGDEFMNFVVSNQQGTIKTFVGPFRREMKLETLEKLVVEDSKTIYLANSANKSLKIFSGSGFYTANTENFEGDKFSPRLTSSGDYTYQITDRCTNENAWRTLHAVVADNLLIDCPSAVIMNHPFAINVIPRYGNIEIPTEFHELIGIDVETAKKTDSPTIFTMTPHKFGFLTIKASTASGITATKEVKVLAPIVVEPSNIIILPGENIDLKVVSGPTDVVLSGFDKKTISMTGLTLTSISPGRTTISVKAAGVIDFEPFIVNVTVAKPLDLIVTPSSTEPIQGGVLEFDVIVVTNCGNYTPRFCSYEINNFAYSKLSESRILVNLDASGPLHLTTTAYGLIKVVNMNVEMILNLPNSVVIAPLSSIQLDAPGCVFSFACGYHSMNLTQSGLVKAAATTESAVVVVKSKYGQVASVIVRVEVPKYLSLSSQGQLVTAQMLDRNGQKFNSCNNVKFNYTFDGTGQKNNANMTERIHFNNVISAVAFNSAFSIHSKSLSPTLLVVPDRPIILLHSKIQMRAADDKPATWTADSPIVRFGLNGTLKAKRVGSTMIQNSLGGRTQVTVVKLEKLRLDIISDKAVEVVPLTNIESIAWKNIQLPDDIQLQCSISGRRSVATTVMNSSGLYCLFSAHGQSATLTATLASKKTKIYFTESKVIKSPGSTKLGLPVGYAVRLSEARLSSVVRIDTKNVTVVSSPPSVVVSVSAGKIVITAKEGGASGVIVLQNTYTGQTAEIEVVWESGALSSQVQVPKKAKYVMFYLMIMLLIVSLYVILAQLGLV